MSVAKAYINHDRVVVDCPTYRCGSAYIVEPGQTSRICDSKQSGCKAFFTIETPDDLDALLAELRKRPWPDLRNWLPEGHHLAVAGHPVGQSASDLAREFAELGPKEEAERARKSRGE